MGAFIPGVFWVIGWSVVCVGGARLVPDFAAGFGLLWLFGMPGGLWVLGEQAFPKQGRSVKEEVVQGQLQVVMIVAVCLFVAVAYVWVQRKVEAFQRTAPTISADLTDMWRDIRSIDVKLPHIEIDAQGDINK